MAKFKPKVTGLKGAQRKMDLYAARNTRAMKSGTVKTALLIKKVSVQGTPRRTGNLANSAFVTISKGPVGVASAFKGADAAKMSAGHSVVLAKATAATAQAGRRRFLAAIGHSAFYAKEVHENPTAGAAGFGGEADQTDQNLNRLRAESVHSAVGGWKFLLKARTQWGPQLPRIIAAEARALR